MDKMGLTSRIHHSHVLRQWSIYPVNATRAVPKVKEDKFISGATWGKKTHSVPLLLTALFWDLFQYVLCATTRGAETKHVVSIMCLDSVSLELETLVFFSDCKRKDSKVGRELPGKGYSRVSRFGEGYCFIAKCCNVAQANPASIWSLGTHWAKLIRVCRWLHSVMWRDPDLLPSRSSLSPRLPGHSKAQIQASLQIHLNHSSSVCSCLIVLSFCFIFACRVFIAKHIWCCLPMLNIAFFSQYSFSISLPWSKYFWELQPVQC